MLHLFPSTCFLMHASQYKVLRYIHWILVCVYRKLNFVFSWCKLSKYKNAISFWRLFRTWWIINLFGRIYLNFPQTYHLLNALLNIPEFVFFLINNILAQYNSALFFFYKIYHKNNILTKHILNLIDSVICWYIQKIKLYRKFTVVNSGYMRQNGLFI